MRKDTNQSYSYIGGVVAAYWLVSISMVYTNKILLSNEDASIPAPLFVTWYQVSLCVSISIQFWAHMILPLGSCVLFGVSTGGEAYISTCESC